MSKNSAKSAGRSPKSARATTKKDSKSAKSARAVSKTTSKARRPDAKSALSSRSSIAVRSPSVSPTLQGVLRTSSPPMQPSASADIQLRHKYQVGENVYFNSPSFGRAAASGSYTVVKLLPFEGDDCQYRIKSSGEAFERVAKESQLDRM